MSKVALKDVLIGLEQDIKKTSEVYRRDISNFETHEFAINAEDIIEQVSAEMKSREGVSKLTAKTESIIRKEVRKMCRTLYTEFHPKRFDIKGKKWTIVSDMRGSSTNFVFVLGSKPEKRANVFNTFKRIKQKAQRPLIRALNKKLRELNRGRKEGSQAELITAQKGFLDLGHEKDSSVSLQRARVVAKTLFELKASDSLSSGSQKIINDVLGEITFEIGKDDIGPPVDNIRVKMESKRINRASTSKEKSEVLQLNKALVNAAERMGTEWAYIEGSDSSVVKRRKIIIKDFVGPLLSNPKIKVKTEKTKVKKSKGKTRHKSKKPKATKGTYKDKDKTTLAAVQARKGVSSSPLALMAILNKELPSTVRKNMVAPSLVNRTGRFAESVRITDISQTPKGYPSIGYTYQKNPYQVFEQGQGGANVATPERDPRVLIDRSIREIAAEFALGRFYTRRQ